ncbi:MAG: LysR family transcriptional regulator [Variovorax sp.]
MNTANFDWRLVRSFLAALDRGSLLGAARVLGSSQPTIGRHIMELEGQLGTVLFERTGRGLLPTAMALRLADAARTMEAGAHALARSVSGAQVIASGTVRVSASQPVAVHAAEAPGADATGSCPQFRSNWCRATKWPTCYGAKPTLPCAWCRRTRRRW